MINNGAVVIPARYHSSRFPGKPLVDICGKSMIQHVYERCVDAVGSAKVYVATDSEKIEEEVNVFGGKVLMTSSSAATGTDRLAEANDVLGLDFIVNVQGDEPLVDPDNIRMVFDSMSKDTTKILNCYCEIDSFEIEMFSVPKVVVSNSGRLIYMSRVGVPFSKLGVSCATYKQVCIYGFSKSHLEAFSAQKNKTKNEKVEDIEILRFLDMDIPVQMLEVASGGVAVDYPNDLGRVISILKNC